MQCKKKRLRILLGLVLGVLTLCAPVVMPSHARVAFAHESVEYPDIPKNHWVYVAMYKLNQDGLIGPLPYNGVCMGCNPLTRYELAIAVARLLGNVGVTVNNVQCRKCMPKLPKNISDASGFVKRPEIMDAINALRREFEPEMRALGVRLGGSDKP